MNYTESIGRTTRSSFVRTAGLLCIAGALLGVVGGVVTAFITPGVPPTQYSYPFVPEALVLASIAYAVNHVLLLIGVLGVISAGAVGDRRWGRAGLWTAVVGWAALTLCEFGSIALADFARPTNQTNLLEAGYGVATFLIGVGLIIGGVAVVRAGVWSGWARWVALACGAGVFVLTIPGIMTDERVVMSLAIGAWMAMFVALGAALVRHRR
jgi:hypothetical protein